MRVISYPWLDPARVGRRTFNQTRTDVVEFEQERGWMHARYSSWKLLTKRDKQQAAVEDNPEQDDRPATCMGVRVELFS